MASFVRLTPETEVSVALSDGGFRIHGELQEGPLELRIDAGARTEDGGVLRSTWNGKFEVPARSAELGFVSKGRYLPRAAWTRLPIRHRNVEQVRVEIRHVPQQNLVFWASGGEPTDHRTSTRVVDERVAVRGERNRLATTWLDVASLLPDIAPGLYELNISALETGDDGETTRVLAEDSARVVLTDMQLVAKQSAPDPTTQGQPDQESGTVFSRVEVWALDVHDNGALQGVQVQLVRPSGDVLDTCSTDGKGHCQLAPPVDLTDTTQPFALLARNGEDLSYLRFRDLELSGADPVHGEPYRSEAAYRASVYPDRGVYRPGDTAHLTALIRGDGQKAPEAGLPVSLRLYDPRTRELRRLALQTNAAGFVVADLPFADFAATGRYRVSVEVAERQVGETWISVEEFVPERLAVEAEALVAESLTTDDVPVRVDARWLFGGKAGGSRVDLECILAPGQFGPNGTDDLHFGSARLDGEPGALTLDGASGVLDDAGSATVSCPSPDRSGGFVGSATLLARARVWEGESGRTTVGSASIPVHPERFYVGLKSSAEQVEAGETIPVQGRIVDWNGRTSQEVQTLSVSLYRLEDEVGWVWDPEARRSRYRRTQRRIPVSTTEQAVIGGRIDFDLATDSGADGYLVVARAEGAETELYVSGRDRPWWWGESQASTSSTPRPTQADALVVTVPEQIRVAQESIASVQVPHRGRLLLTLETDEVIRHEWRDVEPGTVVWPFELERFVPNVYVSALLVKDPHLESLDTFLPSRSWGVRSVRVEPTAYVRKVEIDVPEAVRPSEELQVTVDVGRARAATFVTVAAVDQGILSLTNFQTPDPTQALFAKRGLGVRSFETVGWSLLVPPGSPDSSTGGDASGVASRLHAVEPVALWSGLVQVPASGKVTVSLQVPQYRGELRVMVVAADRARMGSAEAVVTVTEPLVVQATIPRFLVDGDLAQVPVFVSNQSDEPQDVDVELWVESLTGGPSRQVMLEGGTQGELDLAPDESGTVVFQLRSHGGVGGVRVVSRARAGDLESIQKNTVPLAPDRPEYRDVSRVELTSGVIDLDTLFDGWVEGTDQSSVQWTTNPYAESLVSLHQLMDYPHGCIEQTTSKTRPLLYVSNLLDLSSSNGSKPNDVADMIQHGVDRVLSMQTPSGGFGYWPGASYPHTWGTAYGSHMLLDAREAGYPVPADALEDALDYLQNVVENQSGGARDTAYPHYVLALAGKGLPARALATLEPLLESSARDRRNTRAETVYLLQASLYLSGDRRYETELKRPEVELSTRRNANDHLFYAALREAGLVLATYRDLFGREGAQELTEEIAKEMARRNVRYSTQEIAWAVTGLGKTVLAGTETGFEGALTVDGRTVTADDGGDSWSLVAASRAQSVQLKVDAGEEGYLLVSTRGASATEPVERHHEKLSLSRTLRTLKGEEIDPTDVELGDTVYLHLLLENHGRRAIPNLALTDRIAAGWEIENPRIGVDALPPWAGEVSGWEPDHMDVRDDRIHVFGGLPAGESCEVIYAVRAVTAGTFSQPEASLEAMYDPDLLVRVAGQTIEIAGPWDGELL
ncbi:MAG: MG2 domain-containing protein [Myxococcota bacterium]|nr:MG2 domain-containing protein [Myxococcota bacterium]